MKSTYRCLMASLAVASLPIGAAEAADAISTLVAFAGANGSEPQGALVADTAGNLYGTTQAGGAAGKGAVFKLSPPASGKTAWTSKVLFSFDGSDGSQPVAGMVFDGEGNLYGTALTGGASGDGVVFELVAPAAGKSAWKEVVLASFSGADGQNAQAGVIFDKAGNLYGATVGGGASSAGTVYRLSPPAGGQKAWTLSTLFSFNGSSDGDVATGTLIMDSDGNIFGTTVDGGTANDGVAFELSPPAGGGLPWNETVLNSFDAAKGIHPYAGLVADAAGDLYGTATGGGAANHGVVFKLSPKGRVWTEKVLVTFKGNNGAYPFANLTIDAGGNLYGATGGGGRPGQGVVYEVAAPVAGASAYKQTVLATFNGNNASGPSAAVLPGSGGIVYGTAVNGGRHNDGVVFKLTP